MNVTIKTAPLPIADEMCRIYTEIIFLLHRADNKQDALRHLEEYREKNYETFMKYFTYFNDPEGIHILQRKASNPNLLYRELFIIS
ncbi:MAG: hypothetical protein NC095_03615 [Muribaculum sp.]|nr:hypothetical protein [Muribaculum sp.]